MKENFDDTQFITLDIDSESKQEVIEQIREIFEKNNFSLFFEEQIKSVKLNYFRDYRQEYFIELKDELFIGEFEDWEKIGNVPDRIKKFEDQIKQLTDIREVSNIKIIITAFAEMNSTSNTEIVVCRDDILKGLFSMSDKNYDVWTDNLIIAIE